MDAFNRSLCRSDFQPLLPALSLTEIFYSKVSKVYIEPLKEISFPRLKLLATVIGCKFLKIVVKQIDNIFIQNRLDKSKSIKRW